MLAAMADAGHRVSHSRDRVRAPPSEDHGLPMIVEWERPVAAVLDHYRLTDVTVVGESLGGGLVIRAAAFEPRIARVVSMDILDDEFEVIARQIGRGVTPALRVCCLRARGLSMPSRDSRSHANLSPRGDCNRACTSPEPAGLRLHALDHQVQHPACVKLVTADVLLLAGADDHYVPLKQLRRQAANLVRARSVTTRTFTEAEQASNHCQVGNIGAAVRVIQGWLELSTISGAAEKAGAPTRAMRV